LKKVKGECRKKEIEGKIQIGTEMQEVEENKRRMQEEETNGKENAGRNRDAGSGRKLKENAGRRNRWKRECRKGQRCRELKNLKGECRKK
jgi:hypothetical protein